MLSAWIMLRFGERVLKIVEGCTDTDEDPKPSWSVRKDHNVRALQSDYRAVGEAISSRFNPEAGRAKILDYYRGLTNAFGWSGEEEDSRAGDISGSDDPFVVLSFHKEGRLRSVSVRLVYESLVASTRAKIKLNVPWYPTEHLLLRPARVRAYFAPLDNRALERVLDCESAA